MIFVDDMLWKRLEVLMLGDVSMTRGEAMLLRRVATRVTARDSKSGSEGVWSVGVLVSGRRADRPRMLQVWIWMDLG
jgi:hypothetical protein